MPVAVDRLRTMAAQVSADEESGQTIISGMGELHLDIYVERMKREYNVDAEVGQPRVNFREAITRKADFDYLHKKQSGARHSSVAAACWRLHPDLLILPAVCRWAGPVRARHRVHRASGGPRARGDCTLCEPHCRKCDSAQLPACL